MLDRLLTIFFITFYVYLDISMLYPKKKPTTFDYLLKKLA